MVTALLVKNYQIKLLKMFPPKPNFMVILNTFSAGLNQAVRAKTA